MKSQQSFSHQPGHCCPSSALPRSSPGSIKSLKLECLPPAHLHPNVSYPAARVFSQHTLSSNPLFRDWWVLAVRKPPLHILTENMGSVRDRSDWRKWGRGQPGAGDSVDWCQRAQAPGRKGRVPIQTGTKTFPQGNNRKLKTGSHFKDITVIQFVMFKQNPG